MNNKIPLHNNNFHKPTIFAWAMYDWAISAFPTVITTFIFAAYFTRKIAISQIIGTKEWGYAIALASIIIVILSPIFGAIADHGGRRKPWLAAFTVLAMAGAVLLWFAKPTSAYVHFTLFCIVVGSIGIEIAQVFYNSFLLSIAPSRYLGRISGWGWGCGYAGGLAALTLTLFVFVQNPPAWLNTATAEHIRICGPVVALWLGIFSLPLFLLVPDRPSTKLNFYQATVFGLKTLRKTLSTLPQQSNILQFLIARMLYQDGLNTVFAFGGIYAAGTFGMSIAQVIQFGIATNIAAGLGAAIFAWVDDFIGAKRTILLAISVLTLLGIGLVFVHSVLWFWILAIVLSLFFGPVQAASRSLMVRLAPPEKITEMFGLYTLSGKATAFMGPWLFATVTFYSNSQRAGMGSVLIFFLLGAAILLRVKENFSK